MEDNELNERFWSTYVFLFQVLASQKQLESKYTAVQKASDDWYPWFLVAETFTLFALASFTIR